MSMSRLEERIAVTVAEAAQLLGTNTKRILRAIDRGELPATKSKPYLICRESLKEYVSHRNE